jgi:hypothetical protein
MAEIPSLPTVITDQYRCYYYGIVSSIILFGLMMSQTWTFFNLSARGRTPLVKIFVAYLVLSATVTTALHISITDFYLIAKAGDPTALADPRQYHLTLISLLLLTINTFGVQCFFALQIWRVTSGSRLSYRVPSVVTIVVMAILSWATSLASLVQVWNNQALIQSKSISAIRLKFLNCFEPFECGGTHQGSRDR